MSVTLAPPPPAPPRVVYLLLWFPKPSETFIFNEVANLYRAGLPLFVITLYGSWRRDLSPEMVGTHVPVERLGSRALFTLLSGVVYWLRHDRARVLALVRTIALRRWRSVEFGAENLWSFFAGFHVARRCQAEGVAHIHAPWALGVATAAWVASALTGIPFSFTGRSHDIFPPDGALPEKLAAASLVRAESQAALEQMASQAPQCRPKLVLTYNGVPLQESSPAPVSMRAPARLLAIGRLVPTKGFAHLLAAVRLLVEQGVDVRLTLAGSGILEPWLRLLVRRYDLTDRVAMPGYVTHDRIPELLQEADVFVMPSVIAGDGNRDGLPTVLLEALLYRLPAVATRISGLGEIVEDGVTGLLVEPGDSAALASAVRWLLEHRDEALAMAERGRARVRECFDASRNHAALVELYRAHAARPTGADSPPAPGSGP